MKINLQFSLLNILLLLKSISIFEDDPNAQEALVFKMLSEAW